MTFLNIQGLRAIAALMVVISHVFWPLVTVRTHWAQPYVEAIGPGGVDIFFVISGFIIYMVAKRSGETVGQVGRVKATYEFAVKRLIRIYPIYWVVFAVASLLMTHVELAPAWMEQKPLLGLLTLTDQPNNRILAGWTLNFEVYFYAVATVALFIFPRHVFLGLMLWFLSIFAVIVAAFKTGNTWMFDVPFASILFEFMFGMIVAALIQRGVTGYALTCTLIGVAGFLIGAEVNRVHGGWGPLPSWWRMSCLGIPSAFIVYGLVAFEARKVWTFPNYLVKLGDSSYSLYLWHQMIFAVVVAGFTWAGVLGKVPNVFLVLGMLGIAIAVGLASFHYLEKPMLRVLGNLLLHKRVETSKIATQKPELKHI